MSQRGTCFRLPIMGRTSSITMPSLVGLKLRTPPEEQKVWCILFVFLPVTLLERPSLSTPYRHIGQRKHSFISDCMLVHFNIVQYVTI